MSGSDTLEFTDARFAQEVLESEQPVLVDFWAPWCRPCRVFAPTVDALATAWRGRVKVGKLNVDENPQCAAEYEIRTIPTLLLFANGEVVERIVGRAPLVRLEEMLEQRTFA